MSSSMLFNAGNVTITSKHFTVANRSFPMEAIRDAEVVYTSRTWTPIVSLLITAITFEISGLSLNRPIFEMVAVLFLMLTATIFWKGGPRYSIALDTRDGYITALTSSERFFVESIGQVMQTTLQLAARHMEPGTVTFASTQPIFRVIPARNEATRPAVARPLAQPVMQGSIQSSMHPRVFAMTPRPTHRTSV